MCHMPKKERVLKIQMKMSQRKSELKKIHQSTPFKTYCPPLLRSLRGKKPAEKRNQGQELSQIRIQKIPPEIGPLGDLLPNLAMYVEQGRDVGWIGEDGRDRGDRSDLIPEVDRRPARSFHRREERKHSNLFLLIIV